MEFKEWLANQYWDWQREEGNSIRSLSDFAKYLGVNQPALSKWINGNGRPNIKSAKKLAEKLGDEAYVMLGIPVPDPFRNVPDEVAVVLKAAFHEFDNIITEKQIDVESEEGKRIFREVFTRHGLTIESIE